MPALLLLYPDDSQRQITSISLAVILATSISGSAACAYRRLIDYRTELLLASAMVPASLAGAYALRLLPRSAFDVAFGLLLVLFAVVSLVGVLEGARTIREPVAPRRTVIARKINRGGGIIQVPLMATVLRIPLDVSVATSQFMLIFMATTGTSIHATAGDFGLTQLTRASLLGLGAIVGAQVGAAVAQRLTDKTISRLLSAGLVVIGGGLILAPVF